MILLKICLYMLTVSVVNAQDLSKFDYQQSYSSVMLSANNERKFEAVPIPKVAAAFEGGIISVPLKSGDFESPFKPYIWKPSAKAQIVGEIADGWHDESSWADVNVVYGRDTSVTNSGIASQRIQVVDVKNGAVQFAQRIYLKKGRVYRLTASLRAATNIQATLQLRQIIPPYRSFGLQKIDISPEWRRFELYTRMEDNADGLIIMGFTEPTQYWIDDVKLDDVTDVTGSGKILRTDNFFLNGSFEAGLSEGWTLNIGGFERNDKTATWEHIDYKPLLDHKTAAEGKLSLALSMKEWSVWQLISPQIPVQFGNTYTASIALKSDKPTAVELGLVGSTYTRQVKIDSNWKRYSVTGVAILGPLIQFRVRMTNKNKMSETPTRIWLDAAMLEESSSASENYRSAFPIELSLKILRPGAIIFDREVAPVTVFTGGVLPLGAKLVSQVENLAGKVTQLPNVALPASALKIKPDSKTSFGGFKITAQVQDQAGNPLSGKVHKIFSRLPRPRKLTQSQVEKSYFGVHVQLKPEMLAIAKATGHRWIRLHDTSSVTLWPNIEVTPNSWTFNDEGIKAAHQAGFKLLGLLGGAPSRVARKPQTEVGYFSSWNLPDSPGALEKWKTYVRQTVLHYRSLITNWEIWNEPYNNGPKNAFFPQGTPEQYAKLLALTSISIRATNPDANIVGICAPGTDYSWLENVLRTAGTDTYDVLSFHYYGGRLQGGTNSQMSGVLGELNTVQNRHGTAKPIWNSEGNPKENLSWYYNDSALMYAQMAAIVRYDVAQIAAGVEKYFLYSMNDHGISGEGNLGLIEYDRSLKPVTIARAVLANMVDGAKYLRQSELKPGVESHMFQHSSGSIVQLIWSNDLVHHTINVPSDMRVLDILGNSIYGTTVDVSEVPLYFVKK